MTQGTDQEKREIAAAEALHEHFGYSNKPESPSSQARRAARVALSAADEASPKLEIICGCKAVEYVTKPCKKHEKVARQR